MSLIIEILLQITWYQVKKYIDDELDKNTILRFSQTLQNYLDVSVGNNTYILTKYDKIQINDRTEIKHPELGGYLLQNWIIICNDKNNNGKVLNFIRSTKTSTGTAESGVGSLPPFSKSSMYIETSSANHGNERIFVSLERTEFLQITNITFIYDRFSILSNESLKSMGRFRIQLLSEDNTWSTQCTLPKTDRYSDSHSKWTLLILNFTLENYDIKFIYDHIDTAHADMCFSNLTITHSVE